MLGDNLRPYVISWNLTYRCNLVCQHCYLDAGPKKHQQLKDASFSDRSELGTQECFNIIDQIVQFAPECLTILTGGEPLLRKDIVEIINYSAKKKLWVVVGTNGVLITESLADILIGAGVRGMALSLDSLEPKQHDSFRRVQGAWENTVQAAKVLHKKGLAFILQTTVAKMNVAELNKIADFAYNELGAKVWNLYFLVQSGRGQFISDLSDTEYSEVLLHLESIQERYRGKMVVNAKCAPHYVTLLLEKQSASDFMRTYAGGMGGCPAGQQYLGIRPNGDLTPCPYLPLFAGNLRNQSLQDLWEHSPLFTRIRDRSQLTGRCGACECKDICGGCRARGFAVKGDVLAEDPLCSYPIGKHSETLTQIKSQVIMEYGKAATPELRWEPDARARIEKIPAFVRGMVVERVEKFCREQGLAVVTVVELESLRSRMPTARIFGSTKENI